mgnify:CR=1 FL=1
MIKKVLLLSMCSFCLFVFSALAPLQASTIQLNGVSRYLSAFSESWYYTDPSDPNCMEYPITDYKENFYEASGIYNMALHTQSFSVSANVYQQTTINSTDTLLEAYGYMFGSINKGVIDEWEVPGSQSIDSQSYMWVTFETTVPAQYNLHLDGYGYSQQGLSPTEMGILNQGTYTFSICGRDNFAVTFDFELSPLSTTSTPVPEPATMLLLGLGLIGVAGVGRTFKK